MRRPGSPPPDHEGCQPTSAIQLWLLSIAAATLSVALRWPYLAESFWVDELHSAWSVWGDLGEVARRAALGNQTPVYYWGLWFWRQLVGDGEVALRMSSVLLSSAACGMVAAGVARYSQSLVGGLAAGAMLACEPNAIFFGTELRVFPAVMLLASVACWSWLEHLRSGEARAAVALFTAVILAAIIQPTSLGVLGWLCISGRSAAGLAAWVKLSSMDRRNRSLILLAGLGLVAAVLLAWWLAGRVLIAAWKHRDQWAAFAAADSPWQIWTIWRWDRWLLMPAALASGLALADRFRNKPLQANVGGSWLRPALVAIAATVCFWIVSASGIAAVFHRRYLIAALPFLVWAGASAIGEASNRVQRWGGGRGQWAALQWIPGLIILLLGVLLVFSRLHEARQSPRLRGENWRGAAAYVSAHRVSGRPVLLYPGLIETQRLLADDDPEARKYLAYPLSGPYNLLPVKVVDVHQPVRRSDAAAAGSATLAVLRCSRRSAQVWAERMTTATPDSFSVESFGGVQVVHFVAGTPAR